jgi:TRAP-type C4-dicarboxylate transport system permease small subunit
LKKLINFLDGLSGAGGWLAGILMVLALLLVMGEVVVRSAFSGTLYIADEYAGYLMAMLTFTGLAYTLRERGHIRMMFLPHILKGRAHILFNMGCFVVGFLFCAALTAYTWEFFWDSVVSQSQSMQISETYLAIPQAFLPLGSLLMTLQFLAEFLKGVTILRQDTEGVRILEEADDLGR